MRGRGGDRRKDKDRREGKEGKGGPHAKTSGTMEPQLVK